MLMFESWLAFSFQAARLGWVVQNAVALRLVGLAGGAAERQPKAPLVIPEKVAALPGRCTDARAVAIKGSNGRDVAKKIIHKNRVRHKKRKLSKGNRGTR